MVRNRQSLVGFTLIELLVVVAIIGILAGFIAVAAPKVLEMAKLNSLDGKFTQLRTMLTAYYAEHSTYPPRYGYLKPEMFGQRTDDINDLLSDGDEVYNLTPYLNYLDQTRNFDLYDDFAVSGDTDLDNEISRLEYAPETEEEMTRTQRYEPGLFSGSVKRLLEGGVRPITYIPVNLNQFNRVARAWEAQSNFDPRPNDTEAGVNAVLSSMRFPPATYDAYVLISAGPEANTRGLLYELDRFGLLTSDNYDEPIYTYHVLGLAAYYMATRDANDNGELDFDFRSRTRADEVDVTYPDAGDDVFRNMLPDFESDGSPRAPLAAGPVIFLSP